MSAPWKPASLAGQVAVVTGASGGIGGAISATLAGEGAQLFLLGRRLERLEAVAAAARGGSPRVEVHAADLTDEVQARAAAARALELFGGVDVLVHSLGLFAGGPVETSPVGDLDRQYQVNVRAPYLATQAFLPSLLARRGRIVVVNSSAGLHPARAGFAAYSASKHALRALADGLRDEVNGRGVRVVSVYPGRTATAMQEEVARFEGQPYEPDRFLRPEEVAASVLHALRVGPSAELTDLQIRPMRS